MCGIAGFVCTHMNREAREAAILGMNDRMLHRGPDGGDFYIDDKRGVVFGHRRLSIQDLSENGSQPMKSHDGRFVMIYNGEIYNVSDIRERLEAEGKSGNWIGTSDTEVLLEAIAAYGVVEALTLTKGMFAIAVYDLKTGTISLARDRIGEKPLYYGYAKGDLIFSSDIDAIRAYPGFDNAIDSNAVSEYIRYGFIPAPLSIYKDIYKLTPGTVVSFDPPYTEHRTAVYYDLVGEYEYGKDDGRFKGDFDDAVDSLEAVLKAAVKSQLVADVPIGAFLSGGIDSSVCVSLMQALSDKPVKTFTIGFDDEKYDESGDAERIAGHLGTDHTCLIISEKELLEVVPKMSEIFTEPFADSSQIPTYLVSKLARSKVTVSLSGDAGDELFAGYNTYYKCAGLYNRLLKVPGRCRRAAGRLIYNSLNDTLYRAGHCLMGESIDDIHEAVCYDMTGMSYKVQGAVSAGKGIGADHKLQTERKRLLEDKLAKGLADIEDVMMLRDLLRYHPDDILVKVDRAGMAVSLENRVPMLDKDVLKLAFSLPVEYKLGREADGTVISKHVLKELLYRYVPKELTDRPKKGFSVPLGSWLKEGPVHDMAWDILTDSRLVRDGYLDKSGVVKLMSDFMKNGENKSLLWSVFVLEQWYRRYE